MYANTSFIPIYYIKCTYIKTSKQETFYFRHINIKLPHYWIWLWNNYGRTVSGPEYYVLNKYMDLKCPFIFENIFCLFSLGTEFSVYQHYHLCEFYVLALYPCLRGTFTCIISSLHLGKKGKQGHWSHLVDEKTEAHGDQIIFPERMGRWIQVCSWWQKLFSERQDDVEGWRRTAIHI